MSSDSKPVRIRDIALAAIVDAGRPVGSKEILDYARKHRLDIFTGSTPRQSIQAAIWKDIHKGRNSPFVMIGPGRVTRKYWVRNKRVPSNATRS